MQSLPKGSAICAGSCWGGALLYGAMGTVIYGAALISSAFFGLGIGLLGLTGAQSGFGKPERRFTPAGVMQRTAESSAYDGAALTRRPRDRLLSRPHPPRVPQDP